ESGIADEDELVAIERTQKERVRAEQRRAWTDYKNTLRKEVDEAISLLSVIPHEATQLLLGELRSQTEPSLKEVYGTVRRAIRFLRNRRREEKSALLRWYDEKPIINRKRYNSHLFSQTAEAPHHVPAVAIIYDAGSKPVDGREVLNACFDANFA